MSDHVHALELRRRLAAWSDCIQPEAVELAGGYRDLLAGWITNAQLAGLQNVVQVASSFRTIKQFVTHQSDKANRTGRYDVQEYWNAVGKALEELRGPAEQMWVEVSDGSPLPDTPAGRQALDELHCRLVREFVQHLVAHSLWARPAHRREQGRSRQARG